MNFVLISVVLLGVIQLGHFEQAAPSPKSPSIVKTTKFGYPCPCKDTWDPVCATDGYTYPNRCVLNCARKVYKKLLGVCAGECPCCRAPYQNDPIEEITNTTSTSSPGWGPGWGWSWGPPPPPPPHYGPPPRPSPAPAPASPSGSMGSTSTGSGKPKPPSGYGGGPPMGGPYGYYGGPFFREGFSSDEEQQEDVKEEASESVVEIEETYEKNENDKDKTEDVKLAFSKPGSTGGWGTCLCTSVYNPICGSNNVTYGNLCEFKCASRKNSCLTQACQGECPCCACNKVEPHIVYSPPS